MKVPAFLKKTFLENLRDWKILIMAMGFAPFFIYLMYGYSAAATPAYGLLLVNQDDASMARSGPSDEVRGLIDSWKDAEYPDGKKLFTVREVTDIAAARSTVLRGDADLLVVIPAGFSRDLAAFSGAKSGAPARLVNHASDQTVRGLMAMALSDYIVYTYASLATSTSLPLDVSMERVGSPEPRSEFDLYVPGLMVLAIILVLFTSAASLIREVDKGTIGRLILSDLRPSEFLAAISLNQILIGTMALALAFVAALSCGYRSDGSTVLLLVFGAATTLSVIGIGLLLAAFLKSIFELLTVGVFPFFILMFFSECMFPLPKIPLFHLGGVIFYANDVLPTTLCARAFSKILNMNAGFGDVAFELIGIVLLTVGYYVLGSWLFKRRHWRVA